MTKIATTRFFITSIITGVIAYIIRLSRKKEESATGVLGRNTGLEYFLITISVFSLFISIIGKISSSSNKYSFDF